VPLVHHVPGAPPPLGRPHRDLALNTKHELRHTPALPYYMVNADPHLNATERRQLLPLTTPEMCSLSLTLSAVTNEFTEWTFLVQI
jgi:hypothetical protein